MIKTKIVLCFLTLLLVSGCGNGKDEEVNNFENLESLKVAIFSEEDITEEDIINEVLIDDERLIIFEQANEPYTYGIALIYEESSSNLIWYKTSAKIALENEGELIGTRFSLYNEKEVEFTIGKNESEVEQKMSEKINEWSSMRTIQTYQNDEILYIISIVL
ncbi:hypothetical protein HXA34_03540 [Salipaludibacillus agaradhaerens]|uniref:hypothetical protein n=1 Tax=Salipaludibacillus agaradhaerens TaxID=76935 RepID=UPI0021508D67|nr:hypothetical protein [Salipaludibacillus agaradhaerens]MCR6105359.1 hypothetical protein [Salipaludibacillus agaradhaerens]MCR6117400.1 hypothetical protein [Salipaludibacillus agaradhaerens]UJW56591.1 hypothetical protein HXZ66_03770 [Bacillus sp. A116_S68]